MKQILCAALLGAAVLAPAACTPSDGSHTDDPQALYATAESLRATGATDRALAYYHRAAQLGYSRAQLRLGQYYRRGGFENASDEEREPSLGDRIVALLGGSNARDTARARKWFRRGAAGLRDSARAGDLDALFILGLTYHPRHYRRWGVKPNRDSARAFWRRAAKRGHIRALDFLSADLAGEGRHAEARRMSRQALADGHEGAYETLVTALMREHFHDGDLSALPPDTLARVTRTLNEGIARGAQPARAGLDRLLSTLRRGASNGALDYQRRLRHLRRRGLLEGDSLARPSTTDAR